MDHFQGKSVIDHLREARAKGATASAEMHGMEMPGHFVAGLDALKEIGFATLILWILGIPLFGLSLFCVGWLIWKTGRSALIGQARIERLHRVIEEERSEIENHRQQEREELTALYQAKGLTGKLLTDVIDVLMADDNRLLQVMLEEELGLSLEVYEHPLKQSVGAATGALLASALTLSAHALFPSWGLPVFAFLLILLATALSARRDKNRVLDALVWNFSIIILTGGTVYFLSRSFS